MIMRTYYESEQQQTKENRKQDVKVNIPENERKLRKYK